MSDFIVNLVRRGAGLAPIVRSRPVASLDEVSPAGDGEPPTIAPPSGAPMAVMPEPKQPSVLPALPASESRPGAMALPFATAPAAVAQRVAVDAPIAPAPVPAGHSVAVVEPAPPERPALIDVIDHRPGQGGVAAARDAEAATMSMRVAKTLPGPRETIVEARRELVPTPVVVVAQRPQQASNETVARVISSAVTESVKTPTILAPRFEDVSVTERVGLVSPILAPERITNDDHPAALDSAGEGQSTPSARPFELGPGLIPERRATSRPNAPQTPGPLVTRPEVRESRTDPALQRAANLVAVLPNAAPVGEHVVDLPAAAEVLRRRENVEVVSTLARSLLLAAQESPAPDRLVEVRIGAVEIHAASPEPPRETAPTPAQAERPSAGFEEFVRLRMYAPWQW